MKRGILILATAAALAVGMVPQARAQSGAQTVRVNAQVQARLVAQRVATGYAADAYIAAGTGSTALNQALAVARAAQAENVRLLDRLDRTTQERDEARAAAATATAEVQRLVALIETSGAVETSLRLQVEAFARETAGLTASATPEELEALERFADDPQVADYLIIERINRAEIAANQAREATVTGTVRADTARRLRGLVALKQQLLLVGKATAMEVVAILEEAMRADSADPLGWVEVAGLNPTAGRRSAAVEAAQQLLDTSVTDRDRAVALGEIGNLLELINDRAGALAAYRES